MAETYPIALPDLGIASVEFSFVNVTPMATSPFTLSTQAQRFKGGRFEATITYPPMKREQAEQVISFLLRLKGRSGTFLLGDPSAKNPQGAAIGDSGTITLDSAIIITPYPVAAGTDTIMLTTTGMSSQTDYLKAGDYLQINTGADARLHKVLTDVDLSGGDADVMIHPETRQTHYKGDPITLVDAKGVFRLRDDAVNWSVNNASIYGLSFSAIEVI